MQTAPTDSFALTKEEAIEIFRQVCKIIAVPEAQASERGFTYIRKEIDPEGCIVVVIKMNVLGPYHIEVNVDWSRAGHSAATPLLAVAYADWLNEAARLAARAQVYLDEAQERGVVKARRRDKKALENQERLEQAYRLRHGSLPLNAS